MLAHVEAEKVPVQGDVPTSQALADALTLVTVCDTSQRLIPCGGHISAVRAHRYAKLQRLFESGTRGEIM